MLPRWTLIIAAGALVATTTLPARGGERKEFFFKYRLSVNVDEESGDGQIVALFSKKAKSDPFDGFHSLPPLKDEPKYRAEPLYGAVTLGINREKRTIVLDQSMGNKLGYDILYVDANRDGRIMKVEKLEDNQRGQRTLFGPIKLNVASGAEKVPQWFLFRLYEYESNGEILRHFSVINAGSYQGIVTFGDHKRLLAVIDSNGNGIYNDLMTGNPGECDRLLVEGDQDGKQGDFDKEQAQPLGRYVLVADKFWKLSVAEDGSSVFVEPLDKPLGTIKSDQKDLDMLLVGSAGAFRFRSQNGTARIPLGTYHVAKCQYHCADKEGRRWDFTAYASEKRVINVVADTTVPLPLGPPLIPKVLVTQSGGDVNLRLEIRGTGGEVYNDVTLERDKRPPVPKVRITDASGSELAILAFHYG